MKFLFAALLICASGFAMSDTEIETKISEAIAQYQNRPSAQWWKDLGPQGPVVLRDMLKRTSSISKKIRLVESMGNFSDSGTADTLKEIIGATDNRVVRYAAIRSLSASQGANEKDFFQSLLKHQDPQTRLDAARALARSGDTEAMAKVNAFLGEEKTAWVVTRLKSETAPKPSAKSGLIHIQPGNRH